MYEDNKFKGCGQENSIKYSAHAFINNASTDVLYHCADIVKKSVMANGQQFYVYACNRNVPAWTGNIATTNYISYYFPNGGYGSGAQAEDPIIINCTPKSATQSVWYGKTVLTNYEYCQKNFGSFSPLTVNYSTASGTHTGSGACNSFGECKYSSQIDVGYCTVK